MKKRKLSVLGLLVCVLIIGGCSNGKSQSSGESNSSASVSSTTKSSSKESSKSSESTTKSSTSTSETSASANSKAFQFMLQGAQSQIPALKEQMGSVYKDISVTEGDANTMIFTYTLAQETVAPVDMEALKPVLVNQVGSMLSSVQSLIDDLKFKFIYLNPDGSEIGSMTITSDDVAAAETESTGS